VLLLSWWRLAPNPAAEHRSHVVVEASAAAAAAAAAEHIQKRLPSSSAAAFARTRHRHQQTQKMRPLLFGESQDDIKHRRVHDF
jgi:hypothetical protein